MAPVLQAEPRGRAGSVLDSLSGLAGETIGIPPTVPPGHFIATPGGGGHKVPQMSRPVNSSPSLRESNKSFKSKGTEANLSKLKSPRQIDPSDRTETALHVVAGKEGSNSTVTKLFKELQSGASRLIEHKQGDDTEDSDENEDSSDGSGDGGEEEQQQQQQSERELYTTTFKSRRRSTLTQGGGTTSSYGARQRLYSTPSMLKHKHRAPTCLPKTFILFSLGDSNTLEPF